MLFTAATLRGLTHGRVSCTYRRWQVVRPKVGSRFTTSAGVVEVTSITRADEQQLTERDAAEAGFDSVAELIKWCSAKGNGDVYRIGIALAGPDPRIELRRTDNLDAADIATLNAKLDRMDRAADQAWTRNTLRQIQRLPGVVSTELAAEVGQERRAYKLRVRRLKALGLTESLERGYRLSPRGRAYLAALDSTG
ncbi:MAG TPA: ASCH domain-containing protein [Propionibacteriaceae bacterium]